MEYLEIKEIRRMIREEAQNMSMERLTESLQRTYLTKLELEQEAIKRGLMMNEQ